MPLIYVTGIETAGKTTACNELNKRGFEAYDIDEGIAHYYNKETGERSEWLGTAEARTQQWHEQNDYMMDRDHVKCFAEQAKEKLIFLCGTTQNDYVVLDLFDKIVYLYLDADTLKARMAKRGEGEFGFASHEKEAVLSWHKSTEKAYRQRGAIMIDATQSVNQVANEILKVIQ